MTIVSGLETWRGICVAPLHQLEWPRRLNHPGCFEHMAEELMQEGERIFAARGVEKGDGWSQLKSHRE